MTPPRPHWAPGWLTLGIVGAAGFLLGVVVLVVARGVVHDEVRTITQTRTVEIRPTVPDVVGLTLGEADGTLSDAGYPMDVIGGGFFGANDDDVIETQDPSAGTELAIGQAVTVDVGG